MSPKKRKRLTKEGDSYNSQELEDIRIYVDDHDENDENLDEKESWRDCG